METVMLTDSIILDEFLSACLNDVEFFEIVNQQVGKKFFTEMNAFDDDKSYYWEIFSLLKKFYNAHNSTIPTQAVMAELLKTDAGKVLTERNIDINELLDKLYRTPFNREYLLAQFGDLYAHQVMAGLTTEIIKVAGKAEDKKITHTEALQTINNLTEQAYQKRMAITSASKERLISEDSYLGEELSEPEAMIPTGFPLLDENIGGGLRATGDLGLFVAPTGKGKTALMLASANATRWLGNNVLFISLETVKTELNTRLRAMETGLTINEIVNGGGVKTYKKEFIDAYMALRRVTDANIYIEDFSKIPGGITPAKLKDVLLHYKKMYNVGICYLDYIDIMDMSEWGREQEWVKLIKLYTKVRAISIATGVPIWSASQVDTIGYDTPIIKLSNLQGAKGKGNAVEKIVTLNRNTFDVQLPPQWMQKNVVTGQELAGMTVQDLDNIILDPNNVPLTQQDLDVATNPELNIYEHVRLFIAKCRSANDSVLIKMEADFSRMSFRELHREGLHDYINRYNTMMGNNQNEERTRRGGGNSGGNNNAGRV